MNKRSITIFSLFILTSVLNIIILDIIEVNMCKSFSFYRLFTMNSTVCKNISKAVVVLETVITTTIIAGCTSIFQNAITCYRHYSYDNTAMITN